MCLCPTLPLSLPLSRDSNKCEVNERHDNSHLDSTGEEHGFESEKVDSYYDRHLRNPRGGKVVIVPDEVNRDRLRAYGHIGNIASAL